MANWLKRKTTKELIVLILVAASFGMSIAYINAKTYDPKTATSIGHGDTLDFLNMYSGGYGSGLHAYRLLVPMLARMTPAPPSFLFIGRRSFGATTQAVMKFAVLNFLFLLGTCIALYYLQLGFSMSFFESFLGVMLFLSSQTVIRSTGIPMPDSAFFFFFSLCMLAIQRDNLLLFLFAHTIGITAKELVMLSLPLILLSLLSSRRKVWMLLATIPGVMIYAIIRINLAPYQLGEYITGTVLSNAGKQIVGLLSPNALINLFLSFGFSWIPAFYVLATGKVPLLLKRWSWLILFIFAGILIQPGMGSVGRYMFCAFPVVVPLAAIGISKWLSLKQQN